MRRVLASDAIRCLNLKPTAWCLAPTSSHYPCTCTCPPQEQLTQITTLVHLGCGVHARAHVPDASRLLVSVGIGFQLECTLDEALRVAALRLEHLRPLAEECSKRVAGIKAHMALVEQGLLGLGAPPAQAEPGLPALHAARRGRWQ